MNAKIFFLFLAVGGIVQPTGAQSVLFDFDSAAVHAPLPVTLTNGDFSATFSGTGQGFSIQPAGVLGFTPVGFSGNCIYPSSIDAADLHATFSRDVTSFSILYAPEEYACDSSATMRVTAYKNGTAVGTTTTNAQAGTWPTETLQFNSAQSFDSVVVHYDAAPATGGDYGQIFMADNMNVTPVPLPITLTGSWLPLPTNGFQINFTGPPGVAFNILATTDLSLLLANWPVLGTATEISSGQYQYTDTTATNSSWKFYIVRGG